MRTRMMFLIALVLLPASAWAQAQTAPAQQNVDVAVGYDVLHLSGGDGTFPLGWRFAVGDKVSPGVSIVGEVEGNYKSVTIQGTTVNASLYSFEGGIKVTAPGASKGKIFGQFLVGAAREGAGVTGIGSVSIVGLALEPGVGVDVEMNKTTALRVQGDVGIYRAGGGTSYGFRVGVGVAFKVGGK